MDTQQQLILDELRSLYERIYNASDVVDGKLTMTFSAAGFILTLAVALKPNAIQLSPQLFLPYLAMVILVLVALVPREVRDPIHADWEAIQNEYLQAEEDSAYKQLASNYLYAIAANSKRINRKSWMLTISLALLAIQVIIILILLA